ncbi:hypothetical protein, partial [Shewanella sp.]|uniref:hypothetical protein n=1 Tax=Shewanella sp. TaxID=50422 RepID=UPI003F37E19F
LHKLKQAAEKALNKQLANAKQSLDLRLTSFDEAAHKALKGDLSTVEIAQLAKELRGMTSEERHETVKFSADFARASVLAPAALSGMSGTETGRGIFLKHHAPALLADLEQLEHDLRNIDAIAAHITSGLGELEINIDPQAMASQYRPALDRIDLEPRCGESQARYNERIA